MNGETDPYSSGRSFPHRLELAHGHAVSPAVPAYGALVVSPPRTWLLSVGWQLAGLISAYARPGPL